MPLTGERFLVKLFIENPYELLDYLAPLELYLERVP